MGRTVRLWLVLLVFGVSFVISAIGVTESVETRLVPVFSTQPRCGVGDEPFYYLEIVDPVMRYTVRLLLASGLSFATSAGMMLHRRVLSLLHVSSIAASAAPQPPQSTIPIATIVSIILMIAVVVAVLGFLAIRKMEKP